MTDRKIVISFRAAPEFRVMFEEVLGPHANITFLNDLEGAARKQALTEAEALLTFTFRNEFEEDEYTLLNGLSFMQTMTAGVDQIAFGKIPTGVPTASNAGAWAQPMAEHVTAMVFTAAKRLFIEHAEMKKGAFNQFNPFNKEIEGGTCGIVGFGGIGKESARLLSRLGMKIHAINSSGKTDEDVEFIGTLDDLEAVLGASDVVLLSIARTQRTQGLIGARELGWMKPDAILVNVARGDLVDQKALYDRLVANPDFFACFDSWWAEPAHNVPFKVEHPFFDLPNFIGSPHNSANVPGAYLASGRAAAENMRRYLTGEGPRNLIGDEQRMG